MGHKLDNNNPRRLVIDLQYHFKGLEYMPPNGNLERTVYDGFQFNEKNEFDNNLYAKGVQMDYDCFTFPVNLDGNLVEYSCKPS